MHLSRCILSTTLRCTHRAPIIVIAAYRRNATREHYKLAHLMALETRFFWMLARDSAWDWLTQGNKDNIGKKSPPIGGLKVQQIDKSTE